MDGKVCPECDTWKPREQFPPHSRSRDQMRRECRECRNRIARERYASDLDEFRRRSRARTLKHRTGLTELEYQRLRQAQNGACAICSRTTGDVGGKHELVVDHDHETGVVRGLLCHRCNMALGLLEDDPGRVLRAAAYLAERRSGASPGEQEDTP